MVSHLNDMVSTHTIVAVDNKCRICVHMIDATIITRRLPFIVRRAVVIITIRRTIPNIRHRLIHTVPTVITRRIRIRRRHRVPPNTSI
jgi:hypothetical protein